MTAQAVMAFERKPFPLEPVPRERVRSASAAVPLPPRRRRRDDGKDEPSRT